MDANEETNFKPKSKHEITDIKWHSISEICNKINTKQYRLVWPYMDRLLSKVESQKVTDQRYKIKSKLNTTHFGSRIFCPPMAYNCGGNQAFPPCSVTFIDCIVYVFKDKMLFRIPSRFTKKSFSISCNGTISFYSIDCFFLGHPWKTRTLLNLIKIQVTLIG